MTSKILALALLGFTAAGVVLYPAHEGIGTSNAAPPHPVAGNQHPGAVLTSDRPKVEVVFVLDTTGSMGGLIQAAKEKIWSIATTMAQAQPAPEIRIGLVAYRDRGDSYVTRVVDLSADLDSLYATLMEFQADGGGDGPESVNQALYDAVHKVSWGQDDDAYRVVFLVGDAPPHMDYQDDVKYPVTLAAARQRGILVNAIQCGDSSDTARTWQQVAQLGQGQYLRVEQSGGAVAIATPFDEKLATLSAQLDDTRLYYGSEEEKQQQKRKLEATEKLHAGSSVASRARRATFNASESGAANLLGKGELVEDVASGRVDLSSIEREALPASLQAMSPQEQQALIEENARQRDALKDEIRQLSGQRAAYLKQKVEEAGGAQDSLDEKIFNAVRAQAGKKGLRYEAEAPSY
ncbi:MAG: VWA domain-containing protein [Gammaproteobacteria bacterium]|nr:MAG: VWA domain-containing protein [Gammaproteobacteria bacterium]